MWDSVKISFLTLSPKIYYLCRLLSMFEFILTISGLDLGILSTVEFTASDMKDFFVFIAPFVSKTGVVISSGYKFMLILSDE